MRGVGGWIIFGRNSIGKGGTLLVSFCFVMLLLTSYRNDANGFLNTGVER